MKLSRHLLMYLEVLKQNDVGVDDDFFELGGNSLEAMLVVSHLKRFGHHISMQTLYQYKTVRQIVNYMYQNQQSLGCITG